MTAWITYQDRSKVGAVSFSDVGGSGASLKLRGWKQGSRQWIELHCFVNCSGHFLAGYTTAMRGFLWFERFLNADVKIGNQEAPHKPSGGQK
jgi:hypothetical protein